MDDEGDLKPKLLLVDDTPENLALLVDTLEPAGYQIFVATSGEKALEIASLVKPNLMLIDIMMPGIDGYETCKRLKKDKELKETPVIFLSALNSPEDKVKAFEIGGVDYISKPFNHLEVLARVKTHLQTSKIIFAMNNLIKKAFHEIYTPLSVIDTAIEMQVLEYGTSEYLESIKAASRSLHTIYEDIYYSLKKGIANFKPELVNLEVIIGDRIKYFDIIAKTKNMRFKTEFSSEEFEVFINPTELQRVLDNTLSNAIKYGFENSEIVIKIEDEDDRISVYIINEGKTIKDSDEIFKILYRENDSDIGLGVGLDVVKKICTKNDVAIKVESKDNNTRFIYSFKRVVQ